MISVLTVTYNCQKYVCECIESVLASNFTDWEMLIVDDISSDGTHKRLKQYIRKVNDPRIRLIKNDKKMHCGSAYNLLASKALGDILVVLDGDDAIYPESLSVLDAAYRKYPNLGFIYSQHWLCNSRLEKVRLGVSTLPKTDLATSWEKRRHCFSHLRSCRKEAVVHGIFKPGLKFSVDKYMGMMLESHYDGGFIPRCLYRYRTYSTQLTHRYRSERERVKKQLIASIRDYRRRMGLKAHPIVRIDV